MKVLELLGREQVTLAEAKALIPRVETRLPGSGLSLGGERPGDAESL